MEESTLFDSATPLPGEEGTSGGPRLKQSTFTRKRKKMCAKANKRVKQLVYKLRGGASKPPPSTTWKQTGWTFVGVVVTVYLLNLVNIAVRESLGNEWLMPLGPMGALLGLQYGLTAAPAAQPRSILVGQCISVGVALLFSLWEMEEHWMRQSLSLAVSIALMGKFSVVHPPAAANAYIFAGSRYNAKNFATVLIGSAVAIVTGTLINNLSDKRHYPVYWGVKPIWLFFSRLGSLLCPREEEYEFQEEMKALNNHRKHKELSKQVDKDLEELEEQKEAKRGKQSPKAPDLNTGTDDETKKKSKGRSSVNLSFISSLTSSLISRNSDGGDDQHSKSLSSLRASNKKADTTEDAYEMSNGPNLTSSSEPGVRSTLRSSLYSSVPKFDDSGYDFPSDDFHNDAQTRQMMINPEHSTSLIGSAIMEEPEHEHESPSSMFA